MFNFAIKHKIVALGSLGYELKLPNKADYNAHFISRSVNIVIDNIPMQNFNVG